MVMGMSQERLAEQLGITFQQVQKYEKGTNRISAGRLQEVASVLGADISFFFRGVGVDRSDAVPAAPLTTKALKLVAAFELIESESVRKSILALTRSLSGVREEQAPGSADDS